MISLLPRYFFQSFCETRPVIFHDKRAERKKYSSTPKSVSSTDTCLETRWIHPDRRNRTSTTERHLTAVEVKDSRAEGEAAIDKHKQQSWSQAGKHVRSPFRVLVLEKRGSIKGVEGERIEIVKKPESSKDKTSKKVSFEDESLPAVLAKVGLKMEHETPNEGPFAVPSPETTTTAGDEISSHCKNHKSRPNTCHESCKPAVVFDSSSTVSSKARNRPHSAPPASNFSPSSFNTDVKPVQLGRFVPVIKIPTSRKGGESANDETTSNTEKPKRPLSNVHPVQANDTSCHEESSSSFCDEITACGAPDETMSTEFVSNPRHLKRPNVSKSASASRTTTKRNEDAKNPPRAKSSTALQRRPRTPSSHVVSEGPQESPKDLPPAQALSALRKKIHEDLTQQNRELQLDIQQLYLSKHSEML